MRLRVAVRWLRWLRRGLRGLVLAGRLLDPIHLRQSYWRNKPRIHSTPLLHPRSWYCHEVCGRLWTWRPPTFLNQTYATVTPSAGPRPCRTLCQPLLVWRVYCSLHSPEISFWATGTFGGEYKSCADE